MFPQRLDAPQADDMAQAMVDGVHGYFACAQGKRCAAPWASALEGVLA